MQIIGIQTTTLVDYPGKVACIVFTAGCNFRCPFCYNPQAVLPEVIAKYQSQQIPETAFFNFLESRKHFLEGVSICGGEPTLHSDLYQFAQHIKQQGFKVKLDTNGRDAFLVEKMVNDGILDYVAVDMKAPFEKYSQFSGIPVTSSFKENFRTLLDFLLTNGVAYEYRSTLIKGYHTADDVEKMAQQLYGIKQYYLQNYLKQTPLDPYFKGESFLSEELQSFQEIASLFVEDCKIRG
ncbi:MAG: anaerobic ribonucleoside-triphosphate reductase activating protein [Candidatus Peribacteria bacterium]|jgi:pyruvate formate lyase activating enzyme|nr:anaerobic ribonucleoside-triphosphate reductase activating protein [Candidatus Peribacteria bacterium]